MELGTLRKKPTEKIELPSGLTVTVQKVSVLDLAGKGKIPAPLLGVMQKLMDEPTGQLATVKLEDFERIATLIAFVTKACVIDPPIADVADDTHLALDELTIEDQLTIFNWANGDAMKLSSFRVQPGRNGSTGRAGEPVSPAAEHDPESPG